MGSERDGPPIVVNDLRKAFGKQPVLDGVSFQVNRGETLAVLGQSGTGKSVLLKQMIGIQPPDSGSVRITAKGITGLEAKELNTIRKKIGFLFQQAALFDSLTVSENVGFPLRSE